MSSAISNAPGWDPKATPFPKARRDEDAFDTYKSAKDGEVKVPEPYAWLETPPSQSKESKDWVEAQANFTQDYLKGFEPHEAIKKKLEENFAYPRFSCPNKKGDGSFYYSWNSGLDPQPTIYKATAKDVAAAQGGDKPFGTKWFDQSKLSKDGTVALSSAAFSKSGKLYAYGISASGSDWVNVYVRSASEPFVEATADAAESAKAGPNRLKDEIRYVKFSSIAWTHDDAGFFYQRYPTTQSLADGTETDSNKNAALFYHRIGTEQKDDVEVITADPDEPMSMWGAEVSDDGNYLLVDNGRSTERKTRLFIAPIGKNGQEISSSMRWISATSVFEYQLAYIGNDGQTFYFMTNKDAPNWKVVKVQLPNNEEAQTCEHVGKLKGQLKTEDLVPEDPEVLLSSAVLVAENKLLLVRSAAAKDELWQYNLETGKPLKRLMEGQVATVSQIAGRREDHEAFVSSVSFTSPGSITHLAWKVGSDTTALPDETDGWRASKVAGIKAEDFVSEQVFFDSKDGTRVPMFITRPKDVKFDGTAPCWLYFYGGFSISLTPTFSPGLMTFISMTGASLIFVNARGGAEFGDKWHDDGRLLKKRNVFDDVLSAAKYVIDHKIAAPGKIIVNGGSNGGLGAMAVGNLAEEEHGLGAIVAEVGVHDLLKFWQFTIGAAWCADYGEPHKDPKQFDCNYSISPLHNVRTDKVYPTTILLTGDHDDRVVPCHTFKMLAELQHKLPDNPNPILGRIDLNAGHGAGKSTQKRIEETADKYALVGKALGLSFSRQRNSSL